MKKFLVVMLIGVMMFMNTILTFADGGGETLKVSRPEFSRSMSVEEFNKHYWYKEELQKICRDYNISSKGTKAELKSRIECVLLDGDTTEICRKNTSNIRVDIPDNDIVLNIDQNSDDFAKLRVKVINGFRFSAEWREFTVNDLLKVYKIGKQCKSTKEYPFDFMQPEEQTYQWNNFVRDFNRDARSKSFTDKMRVAAILWGKVRDNPGMKRYRSSLIDEYINEINKF